MKQVEPLSLTKEDWRQIALAGEIGAGVRFAVAESRGEDTRPIYRQAARLLRYIQQLGYDDLLDDSEGSLTLSEELYGESLETQSEYSGLHFWSELASELAMRDVHRILSFKGSLSTEEMPESIEAIASRYEAEFDEHGADRLYIVTDETATTAPLKHRPATDAGRVH